MGVGVERCLRSWRALKLWRCADTWRAHQGVDDDHGGSAVRTNEGWWAGTGRPIIAVRFGLGARGLNLQQFTCPLEVVAALGVGDQPIVADAVEAPGQNVQQEAAHELVGTERHRLITRPPLGSVILPAKGDTPLVQGDEASVGE